MKYFTDGFMIGTNPSPVGGGYTIVDENNNLVDRQRIEKAGMTNNDAEIQGIIKALEYAKEGDTISTDSMCCLSWVNKGKSKARPDLNEILMRASLLKFEKKVNLMWEGRDYNLAGIFNENFDKKSSWIRSGYNTRSEYRERMNHLRSISNETV